jgi:molybdate transport system substrate-binding protein
MPKSVALIASLLLSLATPLSAETVSVFAAASLKTALDQVAAEFKAKTGNDVVISYAGSNALAKQILNGAPADIFLSANTQWMDEVESAGLIAADGRKDLLGNSLVLVAYGKDAKPVSLDQSFDLAKALNGGKLAMAMVDSVPAGQYGKSALTSLGLWDSVKASVAQSDNVRSALALVATGEAPLGIVYATDAAAEDNVTVIASFPPESYPEITYPAALLTEAHDKADKAFFEALSAPEAGAIFTAQGFSVLKP